MFKKKKLTKTILRQQLFQPQKWKASQFAFLTHITTWQKAGGGRERERKRRGRRGRARGWGEALSFLLLFPLGVHT